jgi:hypothetical protein
VREVLTDVEECAEECVEECVEKCEVVELRDNVEVDSVELAIALDMEMTAELRDGVRVGKFESTGADSVTEGKTIVLGPKNGAVSGSNIGPVSTVSLD